MRVLVSSSSSSNIIANAINAAYDRGVTVRYIADDDGLNSMLNLLDSNIPIVYRDPALAGIMHKILLLIIKNLFNTLF